MKQYRQGDVLFELISEVPKTIVSTVSPTENNRQLLIIGESRNHGHYITGKAKTYVVSNQNSQDFTTHYLVVQEQSNIEHLKINTQSYTQEHATIVLPPGVYRVIRQREYNAYQKAIDIIKD